MEEADSKNIGKLDLVKFQECIFKANLGLDSIEIERLGRVLDRKNNLTVDYNEFLENLEGPNLPPPDPLKATAARLQMFLRQNDLTANQLLKKLGGRVGIEKFSSFLRKKVQKKFSAQLLDEIAEKFDVNKDGVIDINDMMAILSSKSYLNIASGQTFPTQALSPKRAKTVIKDIRSALVAKKINYFGPMTHATFYHIAEGWRRSTFVYPWAKEICKLDFLSFDQWHAQHFGDMPRL